MKKNKKDNKDLTAEEAEAIIRHLTEKKSANLNPRAEAVCGLPIIRVVMKRRYPGDGYGPSMMPTVELNGIPARTEEEMAILKKLIFKGMPSDDEDENEEVKDLETFLKNNTPVY